MRGLLPAVAHASALHSDLIVRGEDCFCFVELRTVVLFRRVEQRDCDGFGWLSRA